MLLGWRAWSGRACARLGLVDAAIGVFTLALRRCKDRTDTLLRDERAVIYDQVGRKAQARRDVKRVLCRGSGFRGCAEAAGVEQMTDPTDNRPRCRRAVPG